MNHRYCLENTANSTRVVFTSEFHPSGAWAAFRELEAIRDNWKLGITEHHRLGHQLFESDYRSVCRKLNRIKKVLRLTDNSFETVREGVV